MATLGPIEGDDGYVSPEFDLGSDSEEEASPKKLGGDRVQSKKRRLDNDVDMEGDEELALRLLSHWR